MATKNDFRLVVQVIDGLMAVNVGGPVTTDVHTFEISCPELAKIWDRCKGWQTGLDIHAIGVERLKELREEIENDTE